MKQINLLCVESVSVSAQPRPKNSAVVGARVGAVVGARAPLFWEAAGWPWQRLTDTDLITLDRDMLRLLFQEASALYGEHCAAEAFLAVAWHCATCPGIRATYQGRRRDNPRVAMFRSRLRNKHYRGLRDGAHEWAKRMITASTRRSPEITTALESIGRGVDIV